MRTFCNKKAVPMLFILSLLLFPAVSFAEYVGSFSRIEGRVDLLRAGATTVVPARRGDGVSNGDIIRTKSDGRAEILFKDDTTVTVASETRLKIDEYTFNPDNSRNKGILSLLRGKLRAAVSKVKAGLIPIAMGSSTFSVNTPTTVAGVRGTVFFVFFDKGVTGVIFKEGNGFVYNQNMPDKIVNVSAGQATFILTDDAPPLPPRPATEAEMSRHIIDTTIDAGGTIKDDTGTTQPEATLVDTADTMATLGQTGGEDTSAPKTTDTGVDSGPPPPVLPITETNTETLKDTIPPLITIASSPQATTNSTSGSFTVTANEPVIFTYSMDSVGVTSDITTSDTFTLAGLPEGSHTLTITATDAAGNVSTNTYTWTTDYTAPTTPTLSNVPASITKINTAIFGATATDAHTVTYTYTLDGAAVPDGNLSGLTEGAHTFVVTATDAAGNSSTSNYSWTTDYTAPTTPTLSGVPASITKINTAIFGATATDAHTVTYTYTLDGAAVPDGNLSGLTEGAHTFVATATDAAGNSSTSNYSWTTDYTAPTTPTLSGVPASITNINGATIGATANDATTITYSYTLDGSPSTGTFTSLSEGSHTFVATATDGAGNISTTTYSWTTDYTAPVATLTPAASPELTGATAAINVNFGSNETATYSYKLDTGGWNNVTGASVNLTGIAEGTHTMDYSATDTAGNTPSVPNSLSFALSRYSLSGSAGASGITGSITTGEVAGVSNQNWGGWKLGMSGMHTAMPSSFTLNAGGTSTDTTTANNGGYWTNIISGTSGGASLSGTSSLKYLSYDRLGLGTGSFTGSYSAGTWSATDSGTGTYTETPLVWSGRIISVLNNSNVDGIYVAGASLGGLSGGIQSPWSGTTSLTLMGTYFVSLPTDVGPFMWNAPIYSYNQNNLTYTTYDGGAFWGLTGGVWKDRAIDAKVYSLYIGPSGNAGILRGSLTGGYYPELSMFSTDGTWTPTILAAGLTPASLGSLSSSPDISFNYSTSSIGGFAAGGVINGNYAKGLKYSIPNQDWGIWQTLESGAYSGGTSDTWSLSLNPVDVTLGANPSIIVGTMTDGTKWSNGVLAGQTYGYGADITTSPKTWISVGDTLGTFDPVATTWQAVQTGAWLDTNKFLGMIVAGDTAKLAALNIPFVQVGKVTLSGSGNNFTTLSMTDTTFFAYSSDAAPKIWGTGSVTGNYTATPTIGTPITLSGGPLTAALTFQTWDAGSGKWLSTVNGTGGYNGSTSFLGVSAGTGATATTGSITGTGAGVAK